jgi:acetoin utilization protein AcuB
MNVSEIMTREVVTLQEGQSLRDAFGLLQKHRIRHVPVVSEGRLIGIVTDRDLKRATPSLLTGIDRESFDKFLDETHIGQVMTRNPYTVTPSMSLKDAAKVLIDQRFSALPVIEGGKLVGIVTETDLLKALYDMLE